MVSQRRPGYQVNKVYSESRLSLTIYPCSRRCHRTMSEYGEETPNTHCTRLWSQDPSPVPPLQWWVCSRLAKYTYLGRTLSHRRLNKTGMYSQKSQSHSNDNVLTITALARSSRSSRYAVAADDRAALATRSEALRSWRRRSTCYLRSHSVFFFILGTSMKCSFSRM